MRPSTREAVVTLQFNGAGDLEAAVSDLTDLIGHFTGGTTTVAVADRARPVAAIG